ncbi:unnamed protein product, partial [Staurois parvus]
MKAKNLQCAAPPAPLPNTDPSPSLDPTMGGLTTHGAPRAIGDHGAPVSLPKLKKAYEKGTRGISWGPLLTLGPQAV